MTQTIRKAKLAGLSTPDLIQQYDAAVSTYAGRVSNHSPRQVRVNYIVDLLSARADADDLLALAWLVA